MTIANVGNATRYSASGGDVHIHIKLEAQGSQVPLAVRNPGVDVSLELLPHLFGRFVYGDSSRQHSGSNQGLG